MGESTVSPEAVREALAGKAPGNGHSKDAKSGVLDTLKGLRKGIQPLGKTLTLEVPGYNGLLAICFKYIDTDVTEEIANHVTGETKNSNNVGAGLLSGLDTMAEACLEVVVKSDPTATEWKSIVPGKKTRLDPELALLLDYPADDARETILGLFGSGHAVLKVYAQLSMWLTDVTRKVDEGFLAL
jgi:hypothetical protein